ncbi:MAG: InlB B-repeat-containing protein, partial [Lachnospiraceae bacterium]|nr:InlB B-repeat-containing protein [Lachnospiraceae bacterium]
MIRQRIKRKTGFTLAELLVTVAILLILTGIAVPNVIHMQKNMRQKELDAKAETIYVAVQNELVKLRSGGNSKVYWLDNNTSKVTAVPKDMRLEYTQGGEVIDRNIHYFNKTNSEKTTALMNSNVVDEMLSQNHWVVEYEPTGGYVYGVFYSENREIETEYSPTDSTNKYFASLRNKDGRLSDGALVGYYGGDVASASEVSDTSTLHPTITVSNGEKLSVYFQCSCPENTELTFDIMLYNTADTNAVSRTGNNALEPSYKTKYSTNGSNLLMPLANGSYEIAGVRYNTYYCELVLDDLSDSDKRFKKICEKITPGKELTIDIVASGNNNLIESGEAKAYTNSLFADGSTSSEAKISCARHLQNLDSTSGVSGDISSAILGSNITMDEETTSQTSWLDYYKDNYFNECTSDGKPRFKPISNNNISLINGISVNNKGFNTQYRIYGLNVSEQDSAGLFGEVTGGSITLKNIRLGGASIVSTSDGAAGALIGKADGSVVISNCAVRLREKDIQDITLDKIDKYKKKWISGENAGGLVGKLESVSTNASLRIEGSLASTVISGSAAGGLVGNVESGEVIIKESYADSYIFGEKAAGLACGDIMSIENCYAAGFLITSDKSAGLVYGDIDVAKNSYTICKSESKEGDNIKTCSTAKSITSASKVYYCSSGDTDLDGETEEIGTKTTDELCEKLGSAFETDTADSTPYNLRGQALTSYSYPCLKVNPHYGDWQADFRSGTLVYFEEYKNGKFGFEGANVNSTLKVNAVVVGDGYGFVFKTDEVKPSKVTVSTISGDVIDTVNIKSSSAIAKVTGDDNEKYSIYPVTKSAVNAGPSDTIFSDTDNFYQKIQAVEDFNTVSSSTIYAFNPHFAKTAIIMNDENANVPAVPDTTGKTVTISIRTPRQLWNLSRFYNSYYYKFLSTDSSSTVTINQERNADYDNYEWTDYTERTGKVSKQAPISDSSEKRFKAFYNGNSYLITNISFISADAYYVGMIGYNSGKIENVVLVTDYDPKGSTHYMVQRSGNVEADEVVNIGVLSGYNDGSIKNCAAAGYYIAGADGTLHAYRDSTLYAGGMIGSNGGRVDSCECVSPAIRLSSNYAYVSMGGFVGNNNSSGRITNSYDLAFIEVAESKSGEVNASGFAGKNEGLISKSYCASSIVTNGDGSESRSYGFAPIGGAVNNCEYLDQGSFFFVQDLYDYTAAKDRTAGNATLYTDLIKNTKNRIARYSYNHPNTGEETDYPFRAVVKDKNGLLVHYGDWTKAPELGDLGIFYWEHEADGSNSGYHLTYIGTKNGSPVASSTLCTAHDDGGRIKSYGYGYYLKQKGNGDPINATITSSGSSIKFSSGKHNTTVAGELEKQMEGYSFYPFTTRIPESASESDYIYLDNEDKRFGNWTLSYGGSSYEYSITPFFANAMQRIGVSEGLTITGLDGRESDYTKEPGSKKNVYEVRSVDQFRYINWNYKEKNCDTVVFGDWKNGNSNTGNYRDFPFLQYATVITSGGNKQTQNASFEVRPEQFWVQTHDVESVDEDEKITPIAAMGSSTRKGANNENYLFAWFGGNYDGQSYKLKNININSYAYTVGLFGVTAGANIKNIILFSDDENCIKRVTTGKTISFNTTDYRTETTGSISVNFESAEGAYSIGGLIGTAYEFSYYGNGSNNEKISEIENKVENCSIAGYKIWDKSTNQQGAGTANVGGLIGLANVNLERCSAVTDIHIDCTHTYGHDVYGSYERIGGLAGSAGAPGSTIAISDCYTGGEIFVSDRTENEMPSPIAYSNKGYVLRDNNENNQGPGRTSHIYAAGVVCGTFAPYMSNFIKPGNNQTAGDAKITNCYTYLQLPDLKGNVRAVSLIASKADRYFRSGKITVKNCYFLGDMQSVKKSIKHPDRADVSTWAECINYFIYNRGSKGDYRNFIDNNNAPTKTDLENWANDQSTYSEDIEKYKVLIMTDEEFEKMLGGNLVAVAKYVHYQQDNDGKEANEPASPAAISAANLSSKGVDKLNVSSNAVWSMVTTSEPDSEDENGNTVAGASIDGKYSFSSDESQEGKNYPYPAVVTQRDNTFGRKVYVHYGSWPNEGAYWKKGRANIDIFDDMTDTGYAEKELILCDPENEFNNLTTEHIKIPDTGKDKIKVLSVSKEGSNWKIKFRALAVGSVNIKAKKGDASASFILNITSKINLKSSEKELIICRDDTKPITFSAISKNNIDYTKKGKWKFENADEGAPLTINPESVNINGNPKTDITANKSGTWLVQAKYSYTYNNKTITNAMFIPVKVLGSIGLTDRSTYKVYKRCKDGTPEADTISDSDKPVLPDGPELFLFGAEAEDDLDEFKIKGIKVAGQDLTVDASDDNKYSNADYEIRLLPVITSGDYNLRPMYFRYKGSTYPESGVNLEIVLKEPVSGATSEYDFVLNNVIPPRYVISFNGGAGSEGIMYERGLKGSENSFTVPECTFIKAGYSFKNWSDGNTTYSPGSLIGSISSDIVLNANWEANKYTVVFNSNDGTNQTKEQLLTYGVETPLDANTFLRAGFKFYKWNTASDGSGTSYDNSQNVSNLTTEKDGEIILYAQWKIDYLITFIKGTESIGTAKAEGSSITVPSVTTTDNNWTLDGWYVKPQSSSEKPIKVIDANGSVVSGDVDGYVSGGEIIEKDMTLYACYRRDNLFAPVSSITDKSDEGIYVVAGCYK